MSYCTLDEAFGTSFLPKNNCKKVQKKRKKINCNEKKNRFDSNYNDLILNNYKPKETNHLNQNFFNNEYVENLPTKMASYENIEHFSNSSESNHSKKSNRSNNSKKKRKNKKNVNEIFEYDEIDNLPIEESSNFSGHVTNLHSDSDVNMNSSRNESNNESNNESDNELDNESDNESDYNLEKEVTKSVKKLKGNNNIDIITSRINEINNKINFLMNQSDEEGTEKGDINSNIHDIILFIIFGVFVLLILESLLKLNTRILKSKYGLKINVN